MVAEVTIKTERYDFLGVHTGDTGTLVRTTKNYFGDPVFVVRAANTILILSEDEAELVGGESENENECSCGT